MKIIIITYVVGRGQVKCVSKIKCVGKIVYLRRF